MIGSLAVWRLASLLYKEDGPFDVFARLRDIAGVRYDDKSRRVSDTVAGKMLNCFWCTSFWAALAVAFLPKWLTYVLAYSAGAILIREWIGRPD